jgi:hypothetical protein
MGREISVSGIEIGIVEAGVAHAGAEIVGHRHARDAAEVRVHARVRGDPIGQRLRPRQLGERVVARAEHADEKLRVPHLARRRLDDAERLPRIIDEDFLARGIGLPQHGVERLRPRAIERTELRVLVADRMSTLVFQPQEPERHAFALELLMHRGPVR